VAVRADEVGSGDGDGLSESITGGPPGVAAMVVDVVDVVDVVVLDAVPGVLCAG